MNINYYEKKICLTKKIKFTNHKRGPANGSAMRVGQKSEPNIKLWDGPTRIALYEPKHRTSQNESSCPALPSLNKMKLTWS